MRRLREDQLSSLQGAPKRKRFVTIDIESKDEDSQRAGFTRPFMVGVYDGAEYVEFRNEPHLSSRPWQRRHLAPGGCIDKAMNYILKDEYKGCVIYAHNGGGFDYLFMLAWLREHEDEYGFEVVPVQSSIQKISVFRRHEIVQHKKKRKSKPTWTFLDSLKLFPSKLDSMLKTFGIPGKVLHDLHMHEDSPEWTAYLEHDCKGLYEALVCIHDLLENKLGGEVGMTAPSTAMKLFRRRFLGKGGVPDNIPRHAHFPTCRMRYRRKTKPGDCPGCCHEFVRRAYYGGRTEPFKLEGEGLHYYDLNSSYVAAMRDSMPAGERMIENNPKALNWKKHERYIGFAECEVEVPAECHIPPLPHRAPSGKLIFPAGRFRGVWDMEELKLLDHPLVKGKVLKVHKVVWFRRVFLFRDMVDVLWALRDTRRPDFDEGLGALAKLMGNSTYGKFGMKQDRTQIVFRRHGVEEGQCFLCDGEALIKGGLCAECDGSKAASGNPEDDVWYQNKFTDAPYIIPQIAAHITTLARIALWRYMAQVVGQGGKIYYSDTDSIITDHVLPSSKALGELKDEYPGKELHGLFIQPKVYMIEETEESFKKRTDAGETTPRMGAKVTMKGFPKDVRTKENLDKLRAGQSVSFERLEKVRTLARDKFREPPKMTRVTKGFRSAYDKRVVLENGDTAPLVIDEL